MSRKHAHIQNIIAILMWCVLACLSYFIKVFQHVHLYVICNKIIHELFACRVWILQRNCIQIMLTLILIGYKCYSHICFHMQFSFDDYAVFPMVSFYIIIFENVYFRRLLRLCFFIISIYNFVCFSLSQKCSLYDNQFVSITQSIIAQRKACWYINACQHTCSFLAMLCHA